MIRSLALMYVVEVIIVEMGNDLSVLKCINAPNLLSILSRSDRADTLWLKGCYLGMIIVNAMEMIHRVLKTLYYITYGNSFLS